MTQRLYIIIMKFWPQKKFAIESKLPTDEIIERLRKVTHEVKLQRVIPRRIFKKTKEDFEGVIEYNRFTITPVYYFINGIFDCSDRGYIVIEGEITASTNGSIINLTTKFSYGIKFFVLANYVLVAFALMASQWADQKSGEKTSLQMFGAMLAIIPSLGLFFMLLRLTKKSKAALTTLFK